MKKLSMKYNVSNIKIFLGTFNLRLEERNDINVGDSLDIYMNDEKVGVVHFNDANISIVTDCLYGKLIGSTNYAVPSCYVGDLRASNTEEILSTWNNSFAFSLKLFSGNVGKCIDGNITFDVVKNIDDDSKDQIIPRFRLRYSDYEKMYNLYANCDGYTFGLYEKHGTVSEEILYNSNDFDGNISHDKHLLGNNRYREKSSIKEVWSYNGDYQLNLYKEFNGNILQNSVQKIDNLFPKYDKNEMLRRLILMKVVSQKLKQLKDEFNVDGLSFIDRLFVYAFNDYSDELMSLIFDIDTNGFDLRRMYFDDVKNKKLVKKDN